MAYRRRRRSGNGKYRTCKRYKRVRVRGQGMARRCADYTVHRKPSRRRGRTTRRRRTYRSRKPRGMARRGSHCVRYKRVRVRGQGMARRCARYR